MPDISRGRLSIVERYQATVRLVPEREFRLDQSWASLLIAVPAAGFLVRLFMIQHDCGHGAFFSDRRANDWTGRVIGVITLTPYDLWRRTHAVHHATSGHLGRRGMGDVDTLTVREYRERSRWGRLKYRIYRHPLVMFGFAPAYLFFLQQRLPVGLMHAGWQPWLSTMATNSAIALVVGTLVWLVGIQAFLFCASSDHAARSNGRCVAVLRATSIRAHNMGRRWSMECASCGPVRQLALRAASSAKLAHRQHWRAPCTSFV